MHKRTILKLLLAILYFAPILYMLLAFLLYMSKSDVFRNFMPLMMGSHFSGLGLCLILVGITIPSLFLMPNVPDKRAWAIILLFGNMVALPIFWYFYIWKSAPTPDGEQLVQPDASLRPR